MCKAIQVINTYAPHRGYSKEAQCEYWQEARDILKTQATKQCAIWAPGNNGKISHDEEDKDNLIGKWTVTTTTENGN